MLGDTHSEAALACGSSFLSMNRLPLAMWGLFHPTLCQLGDTKQTVLPQESPFPPESNGTSSAGLTITRSNERADEKRFHQPEIL